MNDTIIKYSLRIIAPVMAISSLLVLFRGHNEPGGGFIGALLLAVAILLQAMSQERSALVHWVEKHFPKIIGTLILVLIGITLTPWIKDESLLTGLWSSIKIPIVGKLSTVLLFDIVVYLLVSSSTLYAYSALKRELENYS